MRRAARFHAFAAPPQVEEIPDPPAQPDDEVVVRIERAAVTHIDRTVATGTFELKPALPYVGGVEGVALLDGARHLVRGGGVGLLRDGCWAQTAAVPLRALHRLDADLEPDVAAVFFGPASTAARAVGVVGQVAAGEHVVITGAAGAVGSLALQMALSAGARVTAVVGRDAHADHLPADAEVVVGRGGAAAAALPASPDVLIDTVGGEGVAALVHRVRPGGRAVLIGYTAGPDFSLHLPSWLLTDVAILPVNMVRSERWARGQLQDLAARFASGALRLATDTVPLADLPRALERLAAGTVAGRLVVDPWA